MGVAGGIAGLFRRSLYSLTENHENSCNALKPIDHRLANGASVLDLKPNRRNDSCEAWPVDPMDENPSRHDTPCGAGLRRRPSTALRKEPIDEMARMVLASGSQSAISKNRHGVADHHARVDHH